MLKVVCNTSPILSLLKIRQLDLLRALYGQIIVPHAVWQEMEAGRKKAYYYDLTLLPWIEIRSVEQPAVIAAFNTLDLGEAEVLVIAQEISADLVIIDETIGRAYAHRLGLTLTGTLGILLKAKQQGLVPVIKPLLEALRSQGVWLSDRVVQDVLLLAGEK